MPQKPLPPRAARPASPAPGGRTLGAKGGSEATAPLPRDDARLQAMVCLFGHLPDLDPASIWAMTLPRLADRDDATPPGPGARRRATPGSDA